MWDFADVADAGFLDGRRYTAAPVRRLHASVCGVDASRSRARRVPLPHPLSVTGGTGTGPEGHPGLQRGPRRRRRTDQRLQRDHDTGVPTAHRRDDAELWIACSDARQQELLRGEPAIDDAAGAATVLLAGAAEPAGSEIPVRGAGSRPAPGAAE